MANTFYNTGKQGIIGGGSPAINLLSDNIYLILVASTYTPAVGHSTYADLGSNEVATGGGYTQGGVALGTKSIAIDGTNNRAYFTSTSAQWTSATITARYAIMVRKATASGACASTDLLVGCYDFTTDKSSSNGNFTVQPDATDGWLYI